MLLSISVLGLAYAVPYAFSPKQEEWMNLHSHSASRTAIERLAIQLGVFVPDDAGQSAIRRQEILTEVVRSMLFGLAMNEGTAEIRLPAARPISSCSDQP